MERVNVIGVETLYGLRTLELFIGDVTTVPCDILAVSAFKGGYSPIPGTVLGSLSECHGVSVRDEAIAPAVDLRTQFGIWVTRQFEALPFNRILCVEINDFHLEPSVTPNFSVAIENVFVGLAILEAKGVCITSMALPFLGTGNQNIPHEQIVTPLIEKTVAALRRSQNLGKVTFVARTSEAATVISDEIDRQLGYSRTNLPRRELAGALLTELRVVAMDLRVRTAGLQHRMASEMLEVVSRENPPASEIGLLARRLAEVVADSLHVGRSSIDLFQKIEGLAQRGVSPWVINYLHTLRVIGNEVVHIRDRMSRNPEHIADDDVAVCLFCVLRVARFWQGSLPQG